MDKDSKLSFKDQHIYTGIDVGKKAWSVTILTEQLEHKTFNQHKKWHNDKAFIYTQ